MCGLGDGAIARTGETNDVEAASAAPDASSSRLFMFFSPWLEKIGRMFAHPPDHFICKKVFWPSGMRTLLQPQSI
jgi:hypothetical protein